MKDKMNINMRPRAASKDKSKHIPHVALLVSGLLVAVIMIAGFSSIEGTSKGETSEGGSSIRMLTFGMEVLSTYTATSQHSDENRNENIRLAAAAINETKLARGNQFSFNNIIGDTSRDSRYKEAAVVDGNTITSSQGGGVCQVSSALYIAALEAGMQIIERHPHTIAQDYVPLGLDATVWFGELDFIFKNTTGHPVVIEATCSGDSVTVTIYGTPSSSGETYKANSIIVDTVEAYNEDGTGTDTEYIVNTFRLTYKDGACVHRDLIYTDVYFGSPTFVPEARNLEV